MIKLKENFNEIFIELTVMYEVVDGSATHVCFDNV